MRSKKHNISIKRILKLAIPLVTIMVIGTISLLSFSFRPSWLYNWNGINQQLKDSVSTYEGASLTNGTVGYAAKRPAQYDRRMWIMENAHLEELQKLCKHPDATIKAIAYEGLVRKSEQKDKVQWVIKSLNDSPTTFNYQMGCEGELITIGTYLIEQVLFLNEKAPPPVGGRNPYQLSKQEVKDILLAWEKADR